MFWTALTQANGGILLRGRSGIIILGPNQPTSQPPLSKSGPNIAQIIKSCLNIVLIALIFQLKHHQPTNCTTKRIKANKLPNQIYIEFILVVRQMSNKSNYNLAAKQAASYF